MWPNNSQPRVWLVGLATEVAQELLEDPGVFAGFSDMSLVPEVASASQAMQEAGHTQQLVDSCPRSAVHGTA